MAMVFAAGVRTKRSSSLKGRTGKRRPGELRVVNFETITAVAATPYVPFKINGSADSKRTDRPCGRSSSTSELITHLQHDFPALVWSTGEHLVSSAHVRQRQDGPDLWDDCATFEES
jgi:hypothetical protein